MVVPQLPKLIAWVRFPSPAPCLRSALLLILLGILLIGASLIALRWMVSPQHFAPALIRYLESQFPLLHISLGSIQWGRNGFLDWRLEALSVNNGAIYFSVDQAEISLPILSWLTQEGLYISRLVLKHPHWQWAAPSNNSPTLPTEKAQADSPLSKNPDSKPIQALPSLPAMIIKEWIIEDGRLSAPEQSMMVESIQASGSLSPGAWTGHFVAEKSQIAQIKLPNSSCSLRYQPCQTPPMALDCQLSFLGMPLQISGYLEYEKEHAASPLIWVGSTQWASSPPLLISYRLPAHSLDQIIAQMHDQLMQQKSALKAKEGLEKSVHRLWQSIRKKQHDS